MVIRDTAFKASEQTRQSAVSSLESIAGKVSGFFTLLSVFLGFLELAPLMLKKWNFLQGRNAERAWWKDAALARVRQEESAEAAGAAEHSPEEAGTTGSRWGRLWEKIVPAGLRQRCMGVGEKGDQDDVVLARATAVVGGSQSPTTRPLDAETAALLAIENGEVGLGGGTLTLTRPSAGGTRLAKDDRPSAGVDGDAFAEDDRPSAGVDGAAGSERPVLEGSDGLLAIENGLLAIEDFGALLPDPEDSTTKPPVTREHSRHDVEAASEEHSDSRVPTTIKPVFTDMRPPPVPIQQSFSLNLKSLGSTHSAASTPRSDGGSDGGSTRAPSLGSSGSFLWDESPFGLTESAASTPRGSDAGGNWSCSRSTTPRSSRTPGSAEFAARTPLGLEFAKLEQLPDSELSDLLSARMESSATTSPSETNNNMKSNPWKRRIAGPVAAIDNVEKGDGIV